MAIAETEILPATIYPGMPVTEEDLMRLPRDGRKWELEEGRLTEVPTSIKHEEIIFNLAVMIAPFTRGRGIVTLGQGGFQMTGGNVRVPDVSFTRKDRFPGGHAPDTLGDLAPDLCVEIISPSECPGQMIRKVQEYFDTGAVQVWHVFPEQQKALVFTSPIKWQSVDTDGVLDADGLLPGFSCRVADLFVLE